MADNTGDKKTELLVTITKHLVNTYALEPEQIKKILSISSMGLLESLEQAKHALADNDMQAFSAAAHKVKGILLGVGLKQEAEHAGLIEASAREGKEAAYPQMVTQLLESVQPLLEE